MHNLVRFDLQASFRGSCFSSLNKDDTLRMVVFFPLFPLHGLDVMPATMTDAFAHPRRATLTNGVGTEREWIMTGEQAINKT